nr:type II toxin-antitoxin system prevent-host-death family antitoxin [Niveispirillum sp. SYP-B3756]
MTRVVNFHEAKTNLSRLVEDTVKGEKFIIAKAGKPLVKVVPLAAIEKPPRRLGMLAGYFWYPMSLMSWGEQKLMPFDRILIAQANIEGLLLLTADSTIAHYPGPI